MRMKCPLCHLWKDEELLRGHLRNVHAVAKDAKIKGLGENTRLEYPHQKARPGGCG